VTATAIDWVEWEWVEFACPEHGVLVACHPNCAVRCRCGRRAKPTLNGTVLRRRDIERHRKEVQKSLQKLGVLAPNGTPRAKKRPGRPRRRVRGSEAL
jgi:hypothetical protein